MRYPVILFDLFRTVVLFTPDAPTGQVDEPNWRSAMRPLGRRVAEILPGIAFDAFLDALIEVSREIARDRPPEHLEVPIAERYARALARLGVRDDGMSRIAARLAAAQLEAQAAGSFVPAAHRELLAELRRSRRLGLVSNFDDGPTVHRILAREEIAGMFSAVLVSIEVGRRKPHPTIFAEALQRLRASATEALFVGDSPGDDVAGAAGAGMHTAWLNAGDRPFPAGLREPNFELKDLTDLRRVLADGAEARLFSKGARS